MQVSSARDKMQNAVDLSFLVLLSMDTCPNERAEGTTEIAKTGKTLRKSQIENEFFFSSVPGLEQKAP